MITICKNNFYEKIRYIYLTAMLLCFCIRSIGAYAFLPRMADVLIMASLGIAGVLVLFLGIKDGDVFIDFRKNIFLILFLMIFIVSSVINIRYGIFQNVRILIWTVINFFLIFLYGKSESKENKFKHLVNFQNIIIVSWLILSILSLITFVLRVDYMAQIKESAWVRIGYVENRLFGVFSNPNGTSLVAFIALVFSCAHLKYRWEGSLNRKINWLNIVVQFLYIILSNSRGTIMVFLFATTVVAYTLFYHRINTKKIYKIGLSLVLSVFVCVFLFYFIKYAREGFSYIINLFPQSEGAQFIQDGKIISERIDFVDNNDISNLRFRIWLSAWDIFKTKWFFGTSPGNVLSYAKAVFPDTFIAKRMYHSTHSVWIGMLLYTGVCGAACIFLFFAQCIKKMLKYYIKTEFKEISPMISMCLLVVFSIWAYGLVELEILFVNSVCSFVFWVFLGYAMDYLKSRECK